MEKNLNMKLCVAYILGSPACLYISYVTLGFILIIRRSILSLLFIILVHYAILSHVLQYGRKILYTHIHYINKLYIEFYLLNILL